MKTPVVNFVVFIVLFVSLSCVARLLLARRRNLNRSIPQVPQVPQVPVITESVITESDHTPVPFSYNVPIDSHMNYKNDVVIVVEHPDEHVTIGMAPR